MRPYKNRVLIVCLVLVIAFAAVFFRLDSMMIDGQEASTARATSRSTKTLSVTGMRGTIYDVNMTPLAYDRRSYNVTFYRDPSRSSEADRKTYTRSILKTIQLVESNGKSTITEFWLKKGRGRRLALFHQFHFRIGQRHPREPVARQLLPHQHARRATL